MAKSSYTSKELKDKMTRKRIYLIDNVRYVDISAYLRQESVFSLDDDELIRSKITNKAMMEKCLDLLAYRNEGHQQFIDSLEEDYSWVVKEITEAKPKRQKSVEGEVPKKREPLTGEVKIKTLMKLSGHHQVMDNWRMLARILDVSEADIRQVAHANRDDLKEQGFQMLSVWQGQNSRADATNEVLYQALIEAGLTGAAQDVYG